MQGTIKTPHEELEYLLVSRARYLRRAAEMLGLTDNADYQLFRKVVRGESKNLRIISLLKLKFPEIDTETLWGLRKEDLEKSA